MSEELKKRAVSKQGSNRRKSLPVNDGVAVSNDAVLDSLRKQVCKAEGDYLQAKRKVENAIAARDAAKQKFEILRDALALLNTSKSRGLEVANKQKT